MDDTLSVENIVFYVMVAVVIIVIIYFTIAVKKEKERAKKIEQEQLCWRNSPYVTNKRDTTNNGG